MDKILIMVFGGSMVGLLAMIATLAISSGMVFQGVLVGFLGLMFGGVFLLMLAD